MKLSAQGILRHHFFGEYSAGLGLTFDTPEDAALAAPQLAPPDLGESWQASARRPNILTICVDSAQLERLAAHLATLGADPEAITSVAHSIDHGDPFTVTVEVEDPRQLQLLAA